MPLWLLFEKFSSTCVPSILMFTWVLGCGMITISECTKKKNDKPIVDMEANLKTCVGSVEAPPAKTNTETPVGTTPSQAANVVQTDQKTVNQKKEKALQSAKKKKCADASNKGKKIDEEDDAAGYENCSDMGSEQLRKIAETAPSCKKKS
ncbi:hypothetical protein DdX_02424 [Ditylenchus destructor]|uniref:Uncharacterized protein n=1 Tax=Ditylenchus destructor TaxID=166010 RepID=A0AAD4RC73_9BILA|nr:hypothetical protein DdX_02424 [Ditylenchus destructor]